MDHVSWISSSYLFSSPHLNNCKDLWSLYFSFPAISFYAKLRKKKILLFPIMMNCWIWPNLRFKLWSIDAILSVLPCKYRSMERLEKSIFMIFDYEECYISVTIYFYTSYYNFFFYKMWSYLFIFLIIHGT